MAPVQTTKKAEIDLLELWMHIAEENIQAADDLVDRVFEKASLLNNHPEIGVLRPELGTNVRSFPVAHYIIFYQPHDTGVTVIRVLHSARDVQTTFAD